MSLWELLHAQPSLEAPPTEAFAAGEVVETMEQPEL